MDVHPPSRSVAASLLIFVAAFVTLHWAYMRIPNEVLGDVVYHHTIVRGAAATVNAIAPHEAAQAVGHKLVSPRAVLEVVRGCDGAGVLFLLIAAVLAVRASAKRVLVGIVGALLLVYLLNQLRIVALYFAVLDGDWFTPLHTLVFPSLFVVLAVLGFVLWAGPRVASAPRVPDAA